MAEEGGRPRVIGLLLVGGTGSRIGRDKGLLPFAGRTFAEVCAGELHHVVDGLYISLRSEQADSYRCILPDVGLVFDRPLPVRGPLRGLLSLLDELPDLSPEDGILALSTDLPLIQTQTLLALRSAFLCAQAMPRGETNPHDGVFYERAGQLEPLCGIYGVGLLAEILTGIETEASRGRQPRASLRGYLENRSTVRLLIEPGQEREFTNVNTEEDLRSLESLSH